MDIQVVHSLVMDLGQELLSDVFRLQEEHQNSEMYPRLAEAEAEESKRMAHLIPMHPQMSAVVEEALEARTVALA